MKKDGGGGGGALATAHVSCYACGAFFEIVERCPLYHSITLSILLYHSCLCLICILCIVGLSLEGLGLTYIYVA